MEKNTDRVVWKSDKVRDFRELIKRTVTKYPNNIAYKYKKDYTVKNPEYINKTFSDLDNDVKSFSTALLEEGLEEKKIILIGKNRYEWCVSYLAITTGNMVVAPMDKALPSNEIENLVKRSEAEVIIFDDKYIDTMKKIKRENKKVKLLICMDDEKDKDIKNFSNLLKKGKEALESGNNKYENIKIDPNKMSIMLFTSGTTNLPKIVMLSQNNICQNIPAIANYVAVYPTDTMLSFLPIHHTFECTITFLYGLYGGCTVAFCDGLKHIQQNLKEYEVTIFVAVPIVLETMYKKIVKAIDDQGKTKLINNVSKISNGLLKMHIDLRRVFFKQILEQFGGHLRVVFYGAAPMSKSTIEGFSNMGIKLLQGYGLTETSPVITAETDKETRPGSVGLALPNLDVKIAHPDKEGIGEILVKGPSIMLGYYQDEEKTKEALENGWFKTGDFGYIDEDKFIYVTGRKKDIIVLQNGKNVYPQEIEFLINKIPAVMESLVYLRGQDATDTMLCCKIVYDETMANQYYGNKTEEELKEIMWKEVKEINQTLPIYKKIKKITISTKPFAKTTTQKVKRYEELKKVD